MALPRVLILTQPFVPDTGGGITMSNLFKGWPSEKLAVTCVPYEITNKIDASRCDNYYQLGSEEVKWIFPLNLFSRNYYSGKVNVNTPQEDEIFDNTQVSDTRNWILNKVVHPFLEFIGVDYFENEIQLSPNLKAWIKDFNPDIIYAQCASRQTIGFCTEIKKHLNIPMVYHMMDDWPALMGRTGLAKHYWRSKIDNEFRTLLELSDVHLGISDYMREEYLRRYGKDFLAFHNPIDVAFWQSEEKTDYELSDTPTVLYAGRIGLGIDASLMTIAKAIDALNKELNFNLKFKIQAAKSPSWLKNYKCTEYQYFVEYSDLPKMFSSADFMILPYDFNEKGLAYIKYSMPTKASEYMASGTPIIIYAPEDTALVHYAKQEKWAALVTQQDSAVLSAKIKELVLDKQKRKYIALTAKTLAFNRHNSDKVAVSFQETLCSTLAATK